MTQQTINLGSGANSGNGDPLRTAFTKVNANFTELYAASVGITVSNTAPSLPSAGDLWYDTVSGRIYIYYDSNWVDSNPNSGSGILITNAPEHSYGISGNVAGMIAFDNNYIYYCTGNYVNTSTNIWKRVALDATPW